MEGDDSSEGRGDVLPRDFVSMALTLTSQRDVCRASLVSTTFHSAASADPIWDHFLPPDYQEVLSRAVVPVVFSSKKELYFRLCDSILIDGGTKSFSLVRTTGKKCCTLGPRELSMAWGSCPQYWRLASHPDSRFSEVSELIEVCWLHIYSKIIGSVVLSPETNYAAYFIFKLNEDSSGFSYPAQKTSVRVGHQISRRNVCLQVEQLENFPQVLEIPHVRNDGWMEIEMGEFFNVVGNSEYVYMDFTQVEEMNWKRGLIIQGIELRPRN